MRYKKMFFLISYYSFARYLPPSSRSSLSKKIRYLICKNIFRKCGANVNIERGAWFGRGDQLIIGNNSGLGKNCVVHNNTIIGDDVMMGPNCFLLESKHVFDSIDKPMRLQGAVKKRSQVIIKNDVWIGRDVMIIGDKIIEEGSVIGARTVLTKDFPKYSIIGGNPSRLIRSRQK